MAQEAEEGPVCRICWGADPPRGLADVLVDRPCGCRGHMSHVHLSCLHSWQFHRLSTWNFDDIGRCDVCRQPYNVPEQLWDELVAAGGIDARERQAVGTAQRAGAWGKLLQATARFLHGLQHGDSYLVKTAKLACWLGHFSVLFLDSTQLPAADPPRPPLPRRLLPDTCLTAGVLGILALSERLQLGSWRAVWREGYSARYLGRVAWLLGGLVLFSAVGLADPGPGAAGAPSRQPRLAAEADVYATCSLTGVCLAVSYWPSLLHLVHWLPRACWAIIWSTPQSPPNWPSMPALVGWCLSDRWAVQNHEDMQHAAIAKQCLALLQRHPYLMRQFGNALKPTPADVLSPSLFARFCSALARFLPSLAPSL